MTLTALTALGLTLAVEAPIIALYMRRRAIPTIRIIAAGVLPSLLTQPLAWQATSWLGPDEYLQGAVLIETAVVLVEAVLLKLILPLRWLPALVLSLLANTASLLIGWLAFTTV